MTPCQQGVSGQPPRRRRAPEAPALAGFRLKATLLVGFGLTVAIWVFAGVYFGQRLTTLETEASQVGERYIESQQHLTAARNEILLSSVYVRDALLDTSPTAAAEGLGRINLALGVADQSLADYVPILDSPAEQARMTRLRRQIGELRDTTSTLLKDEDGRKIADAGPLLRDRLMPKRESVLSVAEDLGAMNRSAFVQHQRDIALIYRRTQMQILGVLGLALLGSLGVALASTRYAGQLESRVREQHERDVELQSDLRRLSNRLIRAREQERRSLARELHDEIGQMMTAIKVELAIAQRVLDERGGPSDLLDDARPIADRALQAVRDLSHMLHPSVLDDLGLTAATEWFVKHFRKRYGIRVNCTVPDLAERLAPEIEDGGLPHHPGSADQRRQARRCDGRFRWHPGRGSRDGHIEDNGVGFDPNAPRGTAGQYGLGLVSMRERASQARRHAPDRQRPGSRHTHRGRVAGRLAGHGCRDDARPVQCRRQPSDRRHALNGPGTAQTNERSHHPAGRRPHHRPARRPEDSRGTEGLGGRRRGQRRPRRGRQGVALQPDVAILDIGMPLLNGIEATRQIVKRAAAARCSS